MPRERRRPAEDQSPQLTRERIVEAALRITDHEAGLEQVTVRRLASDLGVGTMTLYSYFSGKDEIYDAMADHVLGRLKLEPASDETPAEAIRAVADALLAMMREHPTVARLFGERVTDSHTALQGAMEAVLQRLMDARIPAQLAVRVYSFLVIYTLGFVSYQVPRPWGRADNPRAAEQRRQRQHFYAGLPMDEFPAVVSLAADLVELPADHQFYFGVEALTESILRELDAATAET